LAASTPFVEGRAPGWLDERMRFYAANCKRVPSVTGLVIPEDVASKAQYEEEILGRMFRDIAPLDPAGVLPEEWLNARRATARDVHRRRSGAGHAGAAARRARSVHGGARDGRRALERPDDGALARRLAAACAVGRDARPRRRARLARAAHPARDGTCADARGVA